MSETSPARVYFSSVLAIFEDHPIVISIVTEKKRITISEGFVSLQINLIQGYTLKFFEYFSNGKIQKYRYHLMDKNNQKVVRWDNAPHYPKLENFPNHKHESGKVFTSTKPELISLLDQVGSYFS